MLRVPPAGLQSPNCRNRRVRAGNGAPDHRREARNLEPVARDDLDLDSRVGIGRRVRAAELVVGVIVVAVVVGIVVVVVFVVALGVAFVGFSLALLPPFGSVVCEKVK